MYIAASDSKWLAARMLLFPTFTEKKKRKRGNKLCEINIGVTASYLKLSTSEFWRVLDQGNKIPTKLGARLYCVVENSKMLKLICNATALLCQQTVWLYWFLYCPGSYHAKSEQLTQPVDKSKAYLQCCRIFLSLSMLNLSLLFLGHAQHVAWGGTSNAN